MSEILKDLNASEFEEKVIQGKGPILVDFWAPWCGPCQMVTPILEELAGEYQGQATIYKVNVDNNGDLAMKYGVSGIPTFVIFKDGEIVARNVGAAPRHNIEALIKKHI